MPEVEAPPLVSVVVPVYGVELYVEECLRSILTQTHAALQVIVVDDGSTDGSMAIVGRLAAEDDRIEIHTYPNGGLGRARNRGVAHARGEYLAFVDSDDVLPTGAIAALVGALETTHSDMATGNVERLTGYARRRSPQHQPALSSRVLRTNLAAKPDLVWSTTSCNSLFRRSFWKRASLRFAHDRLYEDMETTAHAYARAASVDVVGSVTYLWRLREDGSSITQQRTDPRNLEDRVLALEASRRWFATAGPDVLRAFDEKVAGMDLLLYAAAAVDSTPGMRTLLRRECRVASERLGGAPGLDSLPVRARVLHALIARKAWTALPVVVDYLREHGKALPLESAGDGEALLVLPSSLDGRRVPHLPDRTRRVHGDEVALDVTLEDVRWDHDVVELTGRARLRHLDPRHVQLELTAVAGDRRRALDSTVTQTSDGALFVARIPSAALIEPRVRAWDVEVRVQAAGATRTGPIVPGGLRGALAVVEARPCSDATVVTPVVTRGAPVRIDVRRPPFWVVEARVAGRVLDLVVEAAGPAQVVTATLTAPAAGAPVPAVVEPAGGDRFRVSATIRTGVWPIGGPRRAYWRVVLVGADGRSSQPAVSSDAVLGSDDDALVPVATRRRWFSVRDDPYRFEVTGLHATAAGLEVDGHGRMAGHDLVLRTPSGAEVSRAVGGSTPLVLPWPALAGPDAVIEVVHPHGSDPVALADAAAAMVPLVSEGLRFEVVRRRADGLAVRSSRPGLS